jgi:hypothetical protein
LGITSLKDLENKQINKVKILIRKIKVKFNKELILKDYF